MPVYNENVEELARCLSNVIAEHLASLINLGPYQLQKPSLRAWSTVVREFIEEFKQKNPQYDYDRLIKEARDIVNDEERNATIRALQKAKVKFNLKARQFEDTNSYLMVGYFLGHGERLEAKYKGILMKNIVAAQVPFLECADQDAEILTYRHTLRQRYDTRVKALEFFGIITAYKLKGSIAIDVTAAGLQLGLDRFLEHFHREFADLIREKMTHLARDKIEDFIREELTAQTSKETEK